MSSNKVSEIMKQAETLSTAEQLELIERLAERARLSSDQAHQLWARRKWSEAMGIAPNLLNGEDAQEWVSRTRRESDESRERQLKRTNSETTP